MAGMQQSFLLIIQTAFGLYGVAVLLRLMVHVVRADYYQPLVHGINKVTDWPVNKLKKFIPDVRAFEISALVLLLILFFVKAYLVSFVQGAFPNILGVLIWSLGSMVHLFLQTMFYLVIIRAILSWLPAFQMAAIQPLLTQLTEPLMALARRYIPLAGGIDLSPIALLVAIQVLIFIVANPIISLGLRVAL